MENFKYFVQMGRRNADPIVFDAIDRVVAIFPAADPNKAGPVRVHVFEGIAEQIGKHLVQLDFVAVARGQFLHLHFDPGFPDLEFAGIHHI